MARHAATDMPTPPTTRFRRPPSRRPLAIYASDPMTGRNLGNKAVVSVEYESLRPGPVGARLAVIDYNSTLDKYYEPVDLSDEAALINAGLEPSEADPQFHQQMVYAVAMRTIENFDRALGRRVDPISEKRSLRLFPHAFEGANAYYDQTLHAVLFGYFRADEIDAGENMPGQIVFTCLSHDIIVHEVTHAIVRCLKPHYLEPTNPDVLAFHEAFADIVALFQHFSILDAVKRQIKETGSDLRKASRLMGLASQFGHATSIGQALRSALADEKLRLTDAVDEQHKRGAILVAAVFDAFIQTYDRRVNTLIRLAGAEGAEGAALHPDLVDRLAEEAGSIAQSVLNTCIRSFDYMPPVDVTFGDFLRAMVTADVEWMPQDTLGLRAALIEGFRLRGIYADGVYSLAQESLLWNRAEPTLPLMPWADVSMNLLDVISVAASEVSGKAGSTGTKAIPPSLLSVVRAHNLLTQRLLEFAAKNATQLGLNSELKFLPATIVTAFRVSPDGRLSIDLNAQISQVMPDDGSYGGLPPRGGTTLVIGFDGIVRFAISRPLQNTGTEEQKKQADARIEKQIQFLERQDMRDPMTAYLSKKQFASRALARGSLALLHLRR